MHMMDLRKGLSSSDLAGRSKSRVCNANYASE